MLAQFDLTQTLGLILAVYMTAAGIGLLTDSKGYSEVIDDFLNNNALVYIGAIVAFAMGATIIAIHNLWGSPLQFIVSLVGWAAAIEGVLMLAFRRPFFTLIGAIPLNETFLKGYGFAVLIFAAVLFYLVLA